MATQAGSIRSSWSGRTWRTAASGSACGGPEMVSTGWAARTSRGRPQAGSSTLHSGVTTSAGPTIDEHRRPCIRTRSANAEMASGVA